MEIFNILVGVVSIISGVFTVISFFADSAGSSDRAEKTSSGAASGVSIVVLIVGGIFVALGLGATFQDPDPITGQKDWDGAVCCLVLGLILIWTAYGIRKSR